MKPTALKSALVIGGLSLIGTLVWSIHSFWALGANLACSPYYQKSIFDPTGIFFNFSETDCDTLAKEAYAEIFVSSTRSGHKTLVFKYDPEDRIYPSIHVTSGHEIEISIEKVSSIFYQARFWNGMKIRYKIGKIQYPMNRQSPSEQN
jgi:hypothetical protein